MTTQLSTNDLLAAATTPQTGPTSAAESRRRALPEDTAALLDAGRPAKDIERSIDDALADLESEQRRLAELDEHREAVLLAGEDAEVDAVDDEKRLVRRRVDRLGLLVGSLKRVLDAAREREERERLEALQARAQAAQSEGLKRIEKIGKRAGEIADLLRELTVLEGAIVVMNNDLRASNLSPVATANQLSRCRRSELIAPERIYQEPTRPPVTIDGTPADPTWRPSMRRRVVEAQYSAPISNPPLPEVVVLPPADAGRAPIWGPGVLRQFLRDPAAQAAMRRKLGLDDEE